MKELKDLKLKDTKSLKELTLDNLKKELKEAQSRLFNITMKLKTDELKQTHLVKFLRRYIARLKVVILNKTV
ncbi:50S ribosomal protein L29 [Candidatus Gracilibacteria bacterium]|nr:50S ribosomal protein L29 [Candidatus Gracilibacteria bacterium]